LGYAGRVSNDKGISDLFDLFARLSAHTPDIQLQIIGDLDFEDKIPEKLINDLKSNPRIEWINTISQVDLAERMRNWDVQIFLSKREGLGNVILEAGACGIPTFCWDIIGTKDAIPDFARDFLISYGDMELLEKSVSNYLGSPLEQSKKLKLAEWYLDNFEQKKVLSAFIGFIDASLKDYYESK
jgi:glycosyltransferase involved in cell wall biosynthesis